VTMGESWTTHPAESLDDPLPPVDLLADIAAPIEWPDFEAETAARARRVAGGHVDGRLGTVIEWLSGVQGGYPPHDLRRPRLVILAADHGVAAAGVSVLPAGSTNVRAAAIAAGAEPYGGLAELTGTGLRVVDVGLADAARGVEARVERRGSGRIDQEDALTRDEAGAAVRAGAALADEEVDCGADLLLTTALGIGGSTAAATIISVITGVEPAKVVGRGSGIGDDAWMRKVTAVRDARRRGIPLRDDQLGLLAACGGSDLAALTGFVLRAAGRRTPVVLDGVVALAAALVAHEASPRAMRWWMVAQAMPDRGYRAALPRLGLSPIIDLGLSQSGGIGALVSLPLLRAAVRLAVGDATGS
jgi:nicotinate-nucleotide--dimethylbenzimidazole phosphoribosyltransferase